MEEWRVFTIFMGTWVVLGIAGMLFYWKAPLETKRRWHPWFVAGTGVLFVGFVYAMFREPFVLLIMVPPVILIQFLNYKFIKFCPKCGATLYQNPPWTRTRFAP